MSWIVLIDLRENNGHFINIVDEHDNIAKFPTREEAIAAARRNELSDFYPAYAISVDEEEIEYI